MFANIAAVLDKCENREITLKVAQKALSALTSDTHQLRVALKTRRVAEFLDNAHYALEHAAAEYVQAMTGERVSLDIACRYVRYNNYNTDLVIRQINGETVAVRCGAVTGRGYLVYPETCTIFKILKVERDHGATFIHLSGGLILSRDDHDYVLIFMPGESQAPQRPIVSINNVIIGLIAAGHDVRDYNACCDEIMHWAAPRYCMQIYVDTICNARGQDWQEWQQADDSLSPTVRSVYAFMRMAIDAGTPNPYEEVK